MDKDWQGKLFFILLLAFAILGAVAHYYLGFSHSDRSGHAWGSDDAYITYRYARNLADGVGLVFNLQERVEGYSNFLYTLIAATFIKLKIESIYLACVIFNTFIYAGTILLYYKYNETSQSTLKVLLSTMALCIAPILWLWPASGLETSLVLLIQLSIFVAVDFVSRTQGKRLVITYLLLVFMSILLRADGFIFPLLSTFFFLYRRQYRLFFKVIAYIGVITGFNIIGRYLYYGDFMPNTYYAKVSGDLIDRIQSASVQMLHLFHLSSFYIYVAPILGVFYFIIRFFKNREVPQNDLLVIIPFISLGLLSYWVYIGGDVFFERFLLILIPLSMMYFTRLLDEKWLVMLMPLIVVLQLKPFISDTRFVYQFEKYDRWVHLGKFLAVEHPGQKLAVEAAGKIPYFSDLETIDMLGLNDRHIGKSEATFFRVGHNKYDADYVLAKQPELIAGWSANSVDLEWGLVEEKYREKGYEIKYMVNSTVFSKPDDIVDVSGWSAIDVEKLRSQGYKYFVLMRTDKKSDEVQGFVAGNTDN